MRTRMSEGVLKHSWLIVVVMLIGCRPIGVVELEFTANPDTEVWEVVYPGEDGSFGTDDDRLSENVAYLPEGFDIKIRVRSLGLDTRVGISPLARFSEESPSELTLSRGEVSRQEALSFFAADYITENNSRMAGHFHVLPWKDWSEKLLELPLVGR